MSYIDWKGASGATYRYWFVNDQSATGIKAEAGNYAFVKQLPNGNFVPVYFGQASNLKNRIPGHERWVDALKAGATHVMGHTSQASEQVRCAEERDLIQFWNPPLNVHYRQAE